MIEIEEVSKSFGVGEEQRPVLDKITVRVAKDEFVSIVGPSGCGKSTLLHIIAGLEHADSGLVKVEGESTAKRLGRIGYVQQKDLLLPWRTVLDNVILGLELQGVSRSEARKRALELTEIFGLKGFEKQYPFVLSGGMRQRAAFLRTVLLNQEVLLLDEPFGALDSWTRLQMQEWLLGLWRSLKNTIIFVTHNVDEALMPSDRIYVMSARPARIIMTLNVNLPRPRDHLTITQPAFASLKANLITVLHEEGSKVPQQ
jgi:ABC-type nitrate/sulfonate/bicarbonate transport system ATPase subunit